MKVTDIHFYGQQKIEIEYRYKMIWTASDIIYWVAVAFIIYMIVSVIGVIL